MLASNAAERIIVALDTEYTRAQDVARSIAGSGAWVKVGMTMFYREGQDCVRFFKDLGLKVFLDLKMFDIPHQVRGAAASAVQSGADMLTFHAMGGSEMLQAAREGADEAAGELGIPAPVLLGVTVLTSMDDAMLQEIGVERDAQSQVEHLARLAVSSGMDGVVSSPLEAPSIRALLGEGPFIVTPGIRPAGSERGDQKRIATPKSAIEAGATHLVIGRPISAADNPQAAFEAILVEVEQAIADR